MPSRLLVPVPALPPLLFSEPKPLSELESDRDRGSDRERAAWCLVFDIVCRGFESLRAQCRAAAGLRRPPALFVLKSDLNFCRFFSSSLQQDHEIRRHQGNTNVTTQRQTFFGRLAPCTSTRALSGASLSSPPGLLHCSSSRCLCLNPRLGLCVCSCFCLCFSLWTWLCLCRFCLASPPLLCPLRCQLLSPAALPLAPSTAPFVCACAVLEPPFILALTPFVMILPSPSCRRALHRFSFAVHRSPCRRVCPSLRRSVSRLSFLCVSLSSSESGSESESSAFFFFGRPAFGFVCLLPFCLSLPLSSSPFRNHSTSSHGRRTLRAARKRDR